MPQTQPSPLKGPRYWLYRTAGWALFGLGAVGAVLPLLPTVPFWVLAVMAFEKSNPQMARRLRNWPKVGPAICDFLDHGVISKTSKRAALFGISLCAVIIVLTLGFETRSFIAFAGMSVGALYVLTRPSSANAA